MTPNTIPWVIFAVACVFELFIMRFRMEHRYRVLAGSLLLLALALTQGALVLGEPLLFSIPFFIIGLYRLLNCMRYIYGRMHDEYLYRVVPRSSFIVSATQIVVGLGTLLLAAHHYVLKAASLQLGFLQLMIALLLVVSLRINMKRSALRIPVPLPDNKLPSVSVLIPARNETADLEACLKTLTASTYQKLEILVLDDCSQDRTPEIIKQFAHDGVRFIKGSEPGEIWLPKNAAYDKLAHEATGDFLLFCGVDVRFSPDDIHTLVSYALEEKMTMVSVLPKRAREAPPNSVTQQIRYIWELALPRYLAHRPPVLSTLWLIQATALKKYGGMGAVRRNVVPEGFFARELDKRCMYRFLRADKTLGTVSMKPPKEQRDAALRIRYPQLHRRPEVVMAVTAFEFFAIIGVYALLIYGLATSQWPLVLMTMLTALFHIALFVMLADTMGSGYGLSAFGRWLFTVPADLWLMNSSMYLYEFDEVRWKERNVCLPVMHAIPSMPKLPRA